MKRLAPLSIAAALLATAIQAHAQTYTYIDLGVTPYTDTFATGGSYETQAGYGLVGGQPEALIWQNSSGSVASLPSTGYQSTQANGIFLGTAVGTGVTTGGQTVGLFWNGFTQAPVNLNPSFANSSVVNGIGTALGSIIQAGSATLTSTGQQVAVSWSGTAASATNLNPLTAISSQAYATAGQAFGEVGSANFSNVTHAIYWKTGSGTIDLHPTGALRSEALAISGFLNQSGSLGSVEAGDYTTSAGAVHACLWLGTAASIIDLHPASGFTSTTATGVIGANNGTIVNGTVQNTYTTVGYGTRTDGTIVPLVWTNTSNVPTDLSTYLPVGTTSSKALAVDPDYNTIIGTAVINGSNHAFILGVSAAPTFLTPAQSLTTISGLPYSYQVVARGIPLPTLSCSTLPSSMNFSPATGLLTGTPTQFLIGTITATNIVNGVTKNTTQAFSIQAVAAPVMQMNIVGSLAPANGTGYHQALVRGTDGNFYGTSTTGGAGGGGTVYEMTPSGTQTTLHAFGDGSVTSDGAQPKGLSFGSDGSLFGTTVAGGSAGYGTIFNINQGTTTILHHFGDGSVTHDGASPATSLSNGLDGNYYGLTQGGGLASEGTCFSMTPSGSVTILHNFGDGSLANDGMNPDTPMVQDPKIPGVSLYFTTAAGGGENLGGAYNLSPGSLRTANPFSNTGEDGYAPHGPLLFDSNDNLFGIASKGGSTVTSRYPPYYQAGGLGSIYELLSAGTELNAPLHSFGDGTVGNDGRNTTDPNAPLIQGLDGNYYGVTPAGGSANKGCLFQVTPAGKMLVLHSFGDGTITNDGQIPGPIFFKGTDGYFYGVTEQGGANGDGTVYQFGIDVVPVFVTTLLLGPKVGVPYNATITATGFPSPTFSAPPASLPPGLALSSGGVISGTPTASGSYLVTVTASNGFGTNPTKTYDLLVSQAPAFTNGPPPNAAVGAVYSFTYTATGYPTPAFSVTAGALPTGLTLASNGSITGTPTASGVYTGTVTARNAFTTPQPFTIVISDTYTTWATAKFTAAELQDTTYSGPSATPQNDGISNLLKFLYDINPAQPMGAHDLAALPIVATETDAGVQYLTLTYRSSQTASGLTVNVQTSTDPISFQTPSPLDINQNVGTDPNTGDPIIKVGVKTNGVPKLFIRLNVTSP